MLNQKKLIMYLYYIVLSPDYEYENIDKQFRTRLFYNVQFLNNYLGGCVRKLKAETSGYTMLSINLHPTEESCEFSDNTKSLQVNIRFTRDDISYLKTLRNLPERFDYYLSLYERGYRRAIEEGYTEIPLDRLLHIHEQFRSEGYNNSWLWKKKLLREDDTYLFFYIHFSSFDLRMTLTVMDKKKTIVKCADTICQMNPWYDFFWKSFRKLTFTDTEIILMDFIDYPFLSIDRKALCEGKISVTFLDQDYIKHILEDHNIIKKITW